MTHDQAPVKVVLATDSFLIGDGLVSLFADATSVEVVGRARDHVDMLRQVAELVPEAVIISIRTAVITTMATIAIARRLRVEYPEMGIVVISDRVDGFALELLRGGASRTAYLIDERLPNVDTVLDSLRQVRAGQSVLDPGIVDSLVLRPQPFRHRRPHHPRGRGPRADGPRVVECSDRQGAVRLGQGHRKVCHHHLSQAQPDRSEPRGPPSGGHRSSFSAPRPFPSCLRLHADLRTVDRVGAAGS